MAAPVLNIVTAFSRIDNVSALANNVRFSFKRIEARWHCYFDPAKIPKGLMIDCYRSGYVERSDCGGNPQKNMGLVDIPDGWIYFLDDDNLFHPEFERELLQAIKEYPNAKGFVFSQLDPFCRQIRQASRNNYAYGLIDQGQYVLTRKIIGNNRFPLDQSGSDWEVFKSSALPVADEIIPIDRYVTCYNYLRPKLITLL